MRLCDWAGLVRAGSSSLLLKWAWALSLSVRVLQTGKRTVKKNRSLPGLLVIFFGRANDQLLTETNLQWTSERRTQKIKYSLRKFCDGSTYQHATIITPLPNPNTQVPAINRKENNLKLHNSQVLDTWATTEKDNRGPQAVDLRTTKHDNWQAKACCQSTLRLQDIIICF